jgi:rubredoxin
MGTSIEPTCPSCGVQLPKLPQRKTKCKSCGDFIYNKYTPDDRTPRLMNQAQADAAEAAWAKHRVEEAAQLPPRVRQSAFAGDREAVLQMIANTDGEEHQLWRMALIEIDLAKLAARGVRSVQLTAGKAKDRLCPVCQALDQTIISVHAGAQAVRPEGCSCRVKGLLHFTGWIKRPDGTGYVDMAKPSQ